MNTTADLMLTTGEWGKPIDVPLPDGWEYESNETERNLVCPDDWSYWKNEDRTPILCESFAVLALANAWFPRRAYVKHMQDKHRAPAYSSVWHRITFEYGGSLPAAILAVFGGEG